MQKLKDRSGSLKDALNKLPPLKNIAIHGLPDKQVKVELHLEKMAQMHVSLDAVVGAVQGEALNIPGGTVDAGKKSYNIKTSGDYADVDEIRNTIIHAANGRNIYVKDVADVFFEFGRSDHITR